MNSDKNNNKNKQDMLVVGLGASAGGLDPLKRFFKSLPDETGMAFIVVMHLSAEYDSKLAEILQDSTSLNVTQVRKRTRIKPENVYVIPPKKVLSVEDGHVDLTDPDQKQYKTATVDLLFRSLGDKYGRNSACIILSGSGTDGAVGIKSLKENEGLTIAQDPGDAEFSDMPKNAISTGLVDMILPVAKMGEELLKHKEIQPQIQIEKDNEDLLQKVFSHLHTQTGHDFSNYKRSSILRRIKRRMHVNRVRTLAEYLERLEDKPGEVDELFKDLLISVTNFFRDPSAFEALEKDIVPKLFEGKKFDDQVRVWTIGCATGEEAYSLAILLYEYSQKLDYSPEIKVFATDIDEEVLRFGRSALFPESIAAEVTPERLERYFIKDGSHYRVKQEIKDMVLFTPHDLLRDPPFLKLDLLVCRNVLIYLERDLQAEVFKLFHYALNPGKYMFLGMSGSNFEAVELFTSVNKEFRIYQRKHSSTPNFYLPERPLRLSSTHLSSSRFNTRFSQTKSDIKELHQKLLLNRYAPQSVILNEKHEVVHSTDGIQHFLEYSGGEPSRNILEMIKPDLYPALQRLLFQEGNEEKEEFQKIRTQGNLEEGKRRIKLERYPVKEKGFSEGLFQIVFKEAELPKEQYKAKERDSDIEISDEESDVIEALESELEYTRHKLQVSVGETETSNEKLRASNEELQSMNEELHSTTEELETSLEELQSVNEELKLTNQKLENKIDELRKANSDLKNLMEVIEIGILFVDRDFCVQRFTSGTSEIFNLISSDIGRPIDHITHQLEYDSLQEDLEYVLETRDKIKKTIHAKNDRWYIMRQHPYRSVDGNIEGVVITFMEITEIREARKELQQQKQNETLATLGLHALENYGMETIINKAIQKLHLILEVDCILVFSCDHDNKKFMLQANTGLPEDKEYETVIDDNGEWDISFALRNDEPLIVPDYRDENRFQIVPILEDVEITSGLNLQIMGSNGVYGIIGIYTVEEKRSFSNQDLHFGQIVATILGLSMERIEARNRLEESNEQLQQEIQKSNKYQREILHSSVTERWEIGGYLHDNLAQLLASTKIMLTDIGNQVSDDDTDISRDLEELMKAIDDEINNIRDLTHEIIPVNIEDEGVEQAFRFLIRNTQKLHNVNCELKAGDIFDKITDRKLATNLYHVVQEAIRNAVKHGKAENIEISAEEEEGNLFVEIKDDGTGIKETSKDHLGKGLRIMQHRIEILNGNINIQNRHEPGQTGTVITCILPMED